MAQMVPGNLFSNFEAFNLDRNFSRGHVANTRFADIRSHDGSSAENHAESSSG
jgi:hypothetical protein